MSRDRRSSRKICWPNPDRICFEGGCLYCKDSRWIKVDTMLRYISKKDRQEGGKLWDRAYRYGEHSPRVEWQTYDQTAPKKAKA